MRRSQLLNIFFVVFISLVGFGLIMPLIPFYVDEYGGNALVVGMLVAAYALAQFIGAPMMGRLSDRLGRRPVLVAAMGVTSFGFLLLALAEPLGKLLAGLLSPGSAPPPLGLQNGAILGMMFLSRAVTGLAGGSITVAQAYIGDITDEENRTTGMGLIGAAFGLGFIVGPLIGGVLSRWGFAVPAFAASGLALLSLATILASLPESLSAAQKAELATQPKQPLVSIPALVRKLSQPRLGPLLVIRLVVGLAWALFISLLTLWAMARLGLGPRPTSYLIAYVGGLSIVAQVGLIRPLTRRFTLPVLIFGAIVIMGVSMLAWAFTSSLAVLIIIMIPYALSVGVFNTVINSATSWSVPAHAMGDALGASSSLESLSRVISPTLGGWLLGSAGLWAPGLLGAALLACLAPFAWRRLVAHPDLPLEESAWIEAEAL